MESARGAEIDFVIQRDGQLIPIEVKSADNTRAKSLRVYMDTYKPAYAIKLSAKNFGLEDNKKNRSSLRRILYLKSLPLSERCTGIRIAAEREKRLIDRAGGRC